MSTEEEKLYIKKINLKGFKSIENLTVDFEKGLNILIGKNASGKSNFLEGINHSLLGIVSKNSYEYAKFEFWSEKHIVIWEKERTNIKDLFNNRLGLKQSLFIDNQKVFDNYSENESGFKKFNNKKIPRRADIKDVLRILNFQQIFPTHIPFQTPEELNFISEPGYIKLFYNGKFERTDESENLMFLYDIFWEIETYYNNKKNLEKINKNTILRRLKISDIIKDKLKKYSPIQDVRFNENINIYKSDKDITFDNLKIDFKINNNWIPWSQLSDGTKRLFYIITEITDHSWGLVLLEEPEIGVHPHQFNLLMDFLKEESEEKQIIISTHSPQTLNCLNDDELDHILITTYESKKGTIIKHLTKTQTNKAKKYMKEVGFLSDYWMLSDLE